ncbi:MAG TPA: Gfo/Idh/MocA family oxidoreductase [Steroidobacteraceae bacterium]|nr:Gfo/Idh/MocA family oxidoreductase [Steroidobacteraceae bacterium]
MVTGRGPIRVALIGHGLAGAYFHAPLIEAEPGLKIVAVATSNQESLQLRRDAPRMVADPAAACGLDDVELVVIASPNETHFPLAALALRAGKHVVVDKPMVLSTLEADELIALAARQRRLLTVFFNRRLDGDFLYITDLLRRAELGEVMLFEARWDRFRPEVGAGWRNQRVPGAGLLWDLGPHLIDQALCLFGSPDRIDADIAQQRSGAVVDDYFELTLHYGPMRCILSASTLIALPRARFAVHGTNGSCLTFGVDPLEDALRGGRTSGETALRDRLARMRGVRVDAAGRREELQFEAGRWEQFYAELATAIRNGAPPAVDPLQARAGIAIIEQSLLSYIRRTRPSSAPEQ